MRHYLASSYPYLAMFPETFDYLPSLLPHPHPGLWYPTAQAPTHRPGGPPLAAPSSHLADGEGPVRLEMVNEWTDTVELEQAEEDRAHWRNMMRNPAEHIEPIGVEFAQFDDNV
ncbi:hypothetical protein IWQ60_008397 [Tieghemiomyces parasiticus]|uniref:Uncharacterized protein n=1 Tax=Tieghemiomyces parasiticus TaxID=78921 RepID=A0A9W7ZYV6_9FUNG|nr:hypothetical protein IWQ60_008397 [Tieghemiomyces parasiticus]